MMIAIMAVYLTLLFAIVQLGIVRFNLFWKASPLLVLLLLNIGLFIPMGWGAPQGTALVARNSVAIVPSVAGEVTEVPVVANTASRRGRRSRSPSSSSRARSIRARSRPCCRRFRRGRRRYPEPQWRRGRLRPSRLSCV